MPKSKTRPARSTHNPELIKGVRQLGRSAAFRKNGGWKFAKVGAKGKKVEEKKEAVVVQKEAKFYAADDIQTPLHSRKSNHKAPRLRSSLTAGTVLIILAGRFRGKRAVFLKQLPSGLLLVTGPYEINGVPLRRFNAAYVIATSTKIDVSSVDVSKISDDFFAKSAEVKPKDGKFFTAEEKKSLVPAARKTEQKRVDGLLLPIVNKTENLKFYLKAKFSLTKGQKPHALKF